jgi:hypothetical protein
MPFTCSICGEESTRICVRCTKDACDNHLCEKCLRCSDCCECEVKLSAPKRMMVHAALPGPAEAAISAPDPSPEPPLPTPEADPAPGPVEAVIPAPDPSPEPPLPAPDPDPAPGAGPEDSAPVTP